MVNNNIDQEIEEEYESLKNTEKQKDLKRTKIVYIILLIALVTSISSAIVAYANYRYLIHQNESTKSGIIIKYDDSAEYSTNMIVPGWEDPNPKKFTVENNGQVGIKYNLEIVRINTDLNSADNFSYSLYKNNVLTIDNKLIPLNDGIILKNQLIKPGEKNIYKIIFKSNSLIISDAAISARSFSGTFWIRIIK